MGDSSPYSLKPPLHNSSAPRDKEPSPADLDKLRKWQQDRLSRKLRGEYESAVLHLSDVVNHNLTTPVNIASVRIEGATNTRKSFLGFLIKPILQENAPLESRNNLQSVLQTTRHISHVLQQSDIFSSVEARIERARDDLSDDSDVDLVFKTHERGRLYLNSSTELGNNEGSASATARIRNAFGGAEVLEANMALGTKTRRAFRANLTAPLSADLRTYGELIALAQERDNSTFASCTEGLRGLKAVVRNGTPQSGMHEVAYEAVLRHVADLTPSASIKTREAAGQTIKSSISHTYILDTRDDRISATRGWYTKLFQEFAGLGGDAKFYKVEAEGQISRPVMDTVSISFAARTGLLWGISRPTLFSDRFQLGGPTSVRSFRANSMGPHDGVDSIGGDVYYSAGASIISPIPRKPHWPVKTHFWINAGRLDEVDKNIPLSENLKRTLFQPSISVGLGLVYRFDPVRVELNFGLPLIASKSDGYRKGLQVGMGLEFL